MLDLVIGFLEHVLQRQIQATTNRLQPSAGVPMETPREGGLEQGESGSLLRGRFEAMEVHRRRREYGQGRHKDVGEEVVGYLQ